MTLPNNVITTDSAYPAKPTYNIGDHGQLNFYQSGRFGWCIATLPIGRNRTYAISIEGGNPIVRIGTARAEHVHVYLSDENAVRLAAYVELYNKGIGRADSIRDRISSRRAEGQERRARGERSWLWTAR